MTAGVSSQAASQQQGGQRQGNGQGGGPKFHVNIEGIIHEWNFDEITTEQIAVLGGWDASVGVIQVDQDTGEEATLQPGQVVKLKPGMGFQKKVTWKRGHLLDDRLDQELEIIRRKYRDAQRNGMWFLVPEYQLPAGWEPQKISVAAFLRKGYPGIGPYGIYVPSLRFNGQPPENYSETIEPQPPFGGAWAFLSWEAEAWIGKDSPDAGHNVLTFIDGFAKRFVQGR